MALVAPVQSHKTAQSVLVSIEAVLVACDGPVLYWKTFYDGFIIFFFLELSVIGKWDHTLNIPLQTYLQYTTYTHWIMGNRFHQLPTGHFNRGNILLNDTDGARCMV